MSLTTTAGKQIYNTGNPFEVRFGYHRAVRRAGFIFVSGTTSLDSSGTIQYPGNAGQQASAAFATAITAVERLGGSKADVCRVRMYVSRHEDCSVVGQAMKKSFGGDGQDGIGVAATMVVIQNGFVEPDMLVEIELEAMVA